MPSQGTVRYNLSSGQDEVGYLLKDRYTVAGLADERGWPVERYDYDAYGKVYMNRCAVLPWAADFDGDGDVDQNDLTVFLDAYGGSGEAPNGPRGWRADLDGDGDVDGSDYVLFADAYNGSSPMPRGEMSLQSGSMVVSRVGNPFFFTGRRLDVIDKQDAGTPHHFTDDYAGLQLYDYRARTMDPVLGRFGQRDPKGYKNSPDLYEYAKGGPASHRDPDGRDVYDPGIVPTAKCYLVCQAVVFGQCHYTLVCEVNGKPYSFDGNGRTAPPGSCCHEVIDFHLNPGSPPITLENVPIPVPHSGGYSAFACMVNLVNNWNPRKTCYGAILGPNCNSILACAMNACGFLVGRPPGGWGWGDLTGSHACTPGTMPP